MSDNGAGAAVDGQAPGLAALRADIALAGACTYLQTGSEGPMANRTQAAMVQGLRDENLAALLGPAAYLDLVRQAEAARASLAALLHVTPEEVAWLTNTSNAVRFAAASLPWAAGDRLAVSSVEHVSTRVLARAVQQITGRPVTVIDAGPGPAYRPEFFLEQLAAHLTPDHRLLILSHVSCLDGRRLPVEAATRLAHERGVQVLVDGAQAAGQVPVDVAGSDADFYAGSLHKWLLGPAGLGYLVVSRRQLPHYHPLLLPDPYPLDETGAAARPLTAGGQTEVGTESMCLRLAAGVAIETLRAIGLAEVEAHVGRLVGRLRAGLAGIPGLEILSPAGRDLASGILALRLPGLPPEAVRALVAAIWSEERIVVKFQPEYAGIRISVAAFNVESEVEHLLQALASMVPAARQAWRGRI